MVSKICLFSPLKLGRNDRISLAHIFQVCGLTNHQMAVSKNRGTPKSSILIGCSIINHPFLGFSPIFGNTQIGHFSSLFWNKGWELLRLGVDMFFTDVFTAMLGWKRCLGFTYRRQEKMETRNMRTDIPWVVPPPSKSHHQDHYIFSRESL